MSSARKPSKKSSGGDEPTRLVVSDSDIEGLPGIVWAYYHENKRLNMPWRLNVDPYWILVSELMLQQTQVSRVIPKFNQFIDRFPSLKVLACVKFEDVLREWSGLGYNRRARFLWQTAQAVAERHDGQLPADRTALEKLPGIGPNTAGAILAYAFNSPEAYIETNIRTVYLHHLFPGQSNVSDKDLMPHIQRHVPTENPREWYWALMDYGSYLKTTVPNPSRASKHHTKQSKFEGSTRQLRGKVLQMLLGGRMSTAQLQKDIPDVRLGVVLKGLEKDAMIHIEANVVRLK